MTKWQENILGFVKLQLFQDMVCIKIILQYLLKYKAPQFIKEFIIEGEISMAHIII